MVVVRNLEKKRRGKKKVQSRNLKGGCKTLGFDTSKWSKIKILVDSRNSEID